jgi:hypothetical protein
MQEPPLDHDECSLLLNRTDLPKDGLLAAEFGSVIEEAGRHGEDETDLPVGGESESRHCSELEEELDDPDRDRDFDPSPFVASLSRGHARYHRGDPECEMDYRNAFLLDAGLAAREMVHQLEDEIHRDVAYVLLDCRRRLKNNPQDLIARTRLGLALLLLLQEQEAFRELQLVFLQSTVWRPFLRILVNQAKQRRAIVLARMLWSFDRT